MPRVTCSFCGLPFSVRNVQEGANYYCCSGCALASRIPMNAGQLPLSRGLVVALVLGFGLFNEILFALFGGAVTGEGRADVGARLALVSLSIGAVLVASCVVFLSSAKPRRWTDALAVTPALLVTAWAAWRAWFAGPVDAVWILLVANVWLALWLARGWLRRSLARRKK